jgi:hypothetical protein
MGEAWLGSTPGQFYTITSGTFQLDNGLDMRSKEFGTNLPLAIAPWAAVGDGGVQPL